MTAQAAFLRQKRDADPVFASLWSRLEKTQGPLWEVISHAQEVTLNAENMNVWLSEGYRRAPTLERSSARIIAVGQEANEAEGPRVLAIEAELALRRRLAAKERSILESEGSGISSLKWDNLRGYATSELRRWKRILETQTLMAISLAQELAERSRTELERLPPFSTRK